MIDIDPNTRLIDLTVGQLLELIESASGKPTQDAPKERRLEYGIAGIAASLIAVSAPPTASRQAER